MIIGFIVFVALLVAMASISVPVGTLGRFERERREKKGVEREVERELYYGDVVSLQRVVEAIFLVAVTAFSLAAFGWPIGSAAAIIVALEYGALARNAMVRRQSARLYRWLEPKLLGRIQSYSFIKYIRIFTPESPELRLHSLAELRHLVETSMGILSNDEKKLLLSGLDFRTRLVSKIMTPRSMIEAVNKTELLGPLVLDELHKKGHSRLPVIDRDIDHVVGTLYVRDILTLETTKAHTARIETVMEKRVYYIHENQTLEHALAAFIRLHHHLFIVVNEFRETVGLVTLEDVIETLIGREIVDEFDEHDDLRSVAARRPKPNRLSHSSRDV